MQREAAGVSMADVARVLGVTKQAVWYWETHQSVPTVEHALAYGRLLTALAKKAA
jgi:DNA-binding XRE family transcriptional regulator